MTTGQTNDKYKAAYGATADVEVIFAPDSFKGSANAPDVARALAEGCAHALPEARLVQAAMADGGEGTLDCVAGARSGRWQSRDVTGIHGQALAARWYAIDDGPAVIESAVVLGLPLIEASDDAPPLAERGSHALGMLVRAALDAGHRALVIGLGGSACNDAGLGLLIALGARAYDADGREVPPTMAGLLACTRVDTSGLDPRLGETDIEVLCDVDNPLLGEDGACRVYGPQKGLGAADIAAAESAFARLAATLGRAEAARVTGSGAAGGLGFALAALGARLTPGASRLLTLTGLDVRLAAADCVVTGEGRSDAQTLRGKLPLAIARAAAPTPTILVAGAVDDTARAGLAAHFAAIHSLSALAGDAAAAQAEPLRWLRAAGAAVGQAIAAGRAANADL